MLGGVFCGLRDVFLLFVCCLLLCVVVSCLLLCAFSVLVCGMLFNVFVVFVAVCCC